MTDSLSEILKNGGIVAFPTETVYGLGANAFNPDAIKKVFHIKGRPSDNPLIVHISNMNMARLFWHHINDDTEKLASVFWPGPLTIVLEKKADVLDIITAGLNTVALRMPKHEMALHLIGETGPLVAPSANLSGKPSPTKAIHVKQDFGKDFPVIDGGSCKIGLESTVINMVTEPYTILRPGHITLDEIEEVLGKKVMVANLKEALQPQSPGMKYSHYAPDASVRWLSHGENPDRAKTLYLYPVSALPDQRENIICYHSNYLEFARDLYDRFRQADLQGYNEIAIERFEQHDALLNRIEKAIGLT
ncbi:MAG: L-threonylcarbamoyladenylate synthase [Balneolales bacterium]